MAGVFYFCHMTDYLIVGAGLSGIAFAETALKNNKSIQVFENFSQNSSSVAAGIYNPVILKRFSSLFQAQEQLDLMNSFYKSIEAKLAVTVNHKIPVLRKFHSPEEQNDWFLASDKKNLCAFLSTQIVAKKFNCIDSPYGYGEVLQTGYVDSQLLLNKYQEYLEQSGLLHREEFDYSRLEVDAGSVSYNDKEYKHLVFAEGFGMHANPFFNHLPLDGTKGELLIIEAPELNLDVILNAGVFVLPLGNNLFKIGATYNWDDKTDSLTAEGRQELIDRICEVITCKFSIIEHQAGVRPTVKDRKPLIGTHHIHKNLHILNGLGTRGVMLGPAMAKALFENIEFGLPLQKEIDIRRFKLS